MSSRGTAIESMYRVSIPGIRLKDKEGDTWTQFLMTPPEILELYQSIKESVLNT